MMRMARFGYYIYHIGNCRRPIIRLLQKRTFTRKLQKMFRKLWCRKWPQARTRATGIYNNNHALKYTTLTDCCDKYLFPKSAFIQRGNIFSSYTIELWIRKKCSLQVVQGLLGQTLYTLRFVLALNMKLPL